MLKFDVMDVEAKYYADGEDAYAMKRPLVEWAKEKNIEPFDKDGFYKPPKDKTAKVNGKGS